MSDSKKSRDAIRAPEASKAQDATGPQDVTGEQHATVARDSTKWSADAGTRAAVGLQETVRTDTPPPDVANSAVAASHAAAEMIGETVSRVGDAMRQARQVNEAMDHAATRAATAVDETGSQASKTLDQAHRIGEQIEEVALRTADATADLSRQAAEQGRDVMLLGVRAAADMGYDRGHHALTETAQATDIYRDATEQAAGKLHAMIASCFALGSGMQRMQHAWLEMMDSAMDQVRHRPQDLLRCSSLVDYAQVQRELYLSAVSRAFDMSSTMLDLASRAARDAMLPLQAQREVSGGK